MTRSEQILTDAGQAIRDFVLSTVDDVAFSGYLRDMRKFSLGYGHISQVSGIEQTHIMRKDQAGGIVQAQRIGRTSPYAKTTAAKDYVLKPLTINEHGDPDTDPDWHGWWLENCPEPYRAHVLAEYIDNVTLLDAIFLETHGRQPKNKGRDYYMGQRQQGRSWGAICTEIERNARTA